MPRKNESKKRAHALIVDVYHSIIKRKKKEGKDTRGFEARLLDIQTWNYRNRLREKSNEN